jgi:hypothetical protein
MSAPFRVENVFFITNRCCALPVVQLAVKLLLPRYLKD